MVKGPWEDWWPWSKGQLPPALQRMLRMRCGRTAGVSSLDPDAIVPLPRAWTT